jgi:hypothetical protein
MISVSPGYSWRNRRASLSRARGVYLVTVLMTVLCGLACMPAAARARFDVGLQDSAFLAPANDPASQFAYNALRAIHGSTIRLNVNWRGVAPAGTTPPIGFHPANPADPHYDWTVTDAAIRQAQAAHDRVIVDLVGAPDWAQASNRPRSLRIFGGYWNPSARDFGFFASATARRYSGHFVPAGQTSPLPRVSAWEIWNEENLPEWLTASHLIPEYRSLLGAGYRAVKAVNKTNLVVLGGLAPVSFVNGISVSPLTFAAEVLCLRRTGTHFVRAPRCSARPRFDVLAIHPYSLDATPTKHAYKYDDILVGDLGKVDTLLNAARRLNHLKARLWADEWSWFTNPPDKEVGDAPLTAARYTAYSMYEMWKAGVSLVVWFRAMDPETAPANSPSFINGGGLYTSSGKPKPMMRAFSFPVVAGVSGGRGFAWGRAPVSRPTKVTVEQRTRGVWRQLLSTRTRADGVFAVQLPEPTVATYRARLAGGLVSLSYSSTPIPPRRTH